MGPAQLRTLLAVAEGHVHIRYGATPRRIRRHDDGGYSWNTMASVCTVQAEVLERDGYIPAGSLVEEFGLKSRKWVLTGLGEKKITELMSR